MGTLIQAYKEAIIAGDETRAQEIETLICTVENEKTVLSVKVAETTTLLATDKDQHLRLKADFENFRKKTEKDRLNFTSDIRGDVIESLLPMVDSFEKTRKEIQPETEKEKKIEISYQGIYKQFVEVMRSFGVSVVETVGKPFDPSVSCQNASFLRFPLLACLFFMISMAEQRKNIWHKVLTFSCSPWKNIINKLIKS